MVKNKFTPKSVRIFVYPNNMLCPDSKIGIDRASVISKDFNVKLSLYFVQKHENTSDIKPF